MIQIDLENNSVNIFEKNILLKTIDIGTPEAFQIISKAWLRSGWDNKHVYSFTWMGRPIIQLPEDMFRIQEVIYTLKPDVLVETGIAHGGSLIFYASLFKAMGRGRVIGVDIEIRPHNRKAIEEHELFNYITLIEGNSTENDTIKKVKSLINAEKDKTVMVVLDSNHSKSHVLSELEAYSELVTPGSYIVACDGIMADLKGAPRSSQDWDWNNPQEAVKEFLAKNRDFELSVPEFQFNEGKISEPVTYWPNAWLKRKI